MKVFTCLLIMFFVIGCAASTQQAEDDVATSVALTVEALNNSQAEENAIELFPVLDDETLENIDYSKDRITNDIILRYSEGQRNVFFNAGLRPFIFSATDGLTLAMADNYTGNDWIFIHSVVMNTGDNVYRFDLCDSDRNVIDNGMVEERIVICFTEDDMERVEDIASANQVLVRFDGEGDDVDFTLNMRNQESLKYLQQLYMNLSQGTLEIDPNLPAGTTEEQWWIKTEQ